MIDDKIYFEEYVLARECHKSVVNECRKNRRGWVAHAKIYILLIDLKLLMLTIDNIPIRQAAKFDFQY